MSKSTDENSLIRLFSQKWGVPVSEIEGLVTRTSKLSLPSIDGEDSALQTCVSEGHGPPLYGEEDRFPDEDITNPEKAPWYQGLGGLSDEPAGVTIGYPSLDAERSTSDEEAVPPSKELGFLGRYEDLGVLGIGGMGEVRRVRDRSLRRTLAMKIIHQRLMEHPRAVSRFIEEAQVEAQLQHPNIVPVHELGRLPDGRHYFTMKEIRGVELSKKIALLHAVADDERWRLGTDGTSFRYLIRIIQQVCEAVAFSHAQGVIHRDLKPDNIMIGGFGEVLIVDWGLAKVLNREEVTDCGLPEEFVETDRSLSSAHQTRLGSVSGTPCYMAPEQAFGRTENVGTATDVYALGAILHEILSGEPPYLGTSAEEVMEKVKSSPPKSFYLPPETQSEPTEKSVRIVRPCYQKVPKRLIEIAEAAMTREIFDRTLTASRMSAELKSWVEGAEKRDKGLDEVLKAQTLMAEAKLLFRHTTRMWADADKLIEAEGPTSIAGWQTWTEYCHQSTAVQRLNDSAVQHLLGALVHAPDLEEAHEVLAEKRIVSLFRANAQSKRAEVERIHQQLDEHLSHLSKTLRTHFETKIQGGLKDHALIHRLRGGSLVGRHGQVEDVAHQCRIDARLITLLGTAGVGKTRLALELLETLRPDFTRVIFCELADASDASEIIFHLSRSMNVRLSPRDPEAHFVQIVSRQPTLLVLDNLERVVDVIGPMVRSWLEKAETLRVVCTSRQKLGETDEHVVPVRPMSLLGAVELFERRGQMVDPGFAISPDNRGLVCSLVQELDCLPLAIELAAARLDVFSPEELAQRLDERLRLLRSRGRDGQALDAALDWSWELLSPWAQSAMAQSSTFCGGFTLLTAEAVIEVGDDPKRPEMVDILHELVDCSLLREEQGELGQNRYAMLESIRAYASGKLSGLDSTDVEQQKAAAEYRHAAHFSHLGTPESLQRLDGLDGAQLWDELFFELDNLVVGTKYGTPQMASLCCLAALKVLGMNGPMTMGVDLATEVLEKTGIDTRSRRLIEIERSRCLRISGRLDEAKKLAATRTSMQDEALESESVGESSNSVSLGWIQATDLLDRGQIDFDLGEYGEALSLFQGALEVSRQISSKSHESSALHNCGRVHMVYAEFDRAQQFFDEAVSIARQCGDSLGLTHYLASLGNLCNAQRQHEKAQEYLTEGLKVAKAIRNRRLEATIMSHLGQVYRAVGDHTLHHSTLEGVLSIIREIEDLRFEGITLGMLGNSYRRQSDLDRALECFAQAVKLAEQTEDRRFEGVHRGNVGLVYQAMEQCEQASESFEEARKIAHELGDRQNEAIFLGNRGESLRRLGRYSDAEECLLQAVELADKTLPLAAGVFRSVLALTLAEDGRFLDVDSILQKGLTQVEKHPEQHTRFLCNQSLVFLKRGNRQQAQDVFEAARSLFGELGLGTNSELGRQVSDLEQVLN